MSEALQVPLADQSDRSLLPSAEVSSPEPFLVEFSRDSIVAFAPEIEPLFERALSPYGEAAIGEQLTEIVEERGLDSVSRSLKRAIVPLVHAGVKSELNNNAIWLAIDAKDKDERERIITGAFATWFYEHRNEVPSWMDTRELFIPAVSASHVVIDYIHAFLPQRAAFTERLSRDMGPHNLETQYDLIKLLVSSEARAMEISQEDLHAARWLSILLFAPADHGQLSPVARRLVQGMERQSYDDFIAYDLLCSIQSKRRPNEQLDNPLARMIGLVEAAAPGIEIDRAVLTNLSGARTLWSKEARATLERQRSAIGGALGALEKNVRTILRGIIPPPDKETAQRNFDNSLRLFCEGARRLEREMRRQGRVPRKRLGMVPPPRPVPSKPNGGEPEREVLREPATLVFLNRDGQTYDTESPQFKDMPNKVLMGAQRGNRAFAEDVEAMLKGCQGIDMAVKTGYWDKVKSTPEVRIIRGGVTKKVPHFEYRPAKDPHVKLKTAESGNYRVYFADLGGGVYGLTGIEHKDKQDRFLKSLRG